MALTERIGGKTTYINPDIEFLCSFSPGIIREYDMRSAGLSVIKQYGLLSHDDILKLDAMPKLERNIYIGNVRRVDKKFSEDLKHGIRESVFHFLEDNGYEDDNILSINNDAVTVMEERSFNPTLEYGEVKFRKEQDFTGYLRLDHFLIFIHAGNADLTIKGVNDMAREAFKDGFGKILLQWFKRLDRGERPIYLLKELQKYKDNLCSLKAPMSCYVSLKTGAVPLTDMSLSSAVLGYDYKSFPPALYDNIDIRQAIVETVVPLSRILRTYNSGNN